VIWRELDCPNPNLQKMQECNIRRETASVTGAASCTGFTALWCNLRSAERFPVREFKEMKGAPKSRSIRKAETNAGSPARREPGG